MQQYFQLDKKEKTQEWILLSLSIVSFLTIGKGLYNQYHNIDQDEILIPLILIIYVGIFLLYGINGITKGNLTATWTPFFIFEIIIFFVRKLGSLTREKARIFTVQLLGTVGLIISIGFFITTIIILTEK